MSIFAGFGGLKAIPKETDAKTHPFEFLAKSPKQGEEEGQVFLSCNSEKKGEIPKMKMNSFSDPQPRSLIFNLNFTTSNKMGNFLQDSGLGWEILQENRQSLHLDFRWGKKRNQRLVLALNLQMLILLLVPKIAQLGAFQV